MKWKVRPYHPATDEETIIRFHLELLREHYKLWSQITESDYDPDYWEQMMREKEVGRRWGEELAERVGQKHVYLRVFTPPDDDHPIGYLYQDIRPDPHMFHPAGYINEIYLEPAYRGRGWSRAMLEDGEHWFRERGIATRQVFVTSNNLAAVKLYTSLGYRVADYRMMKAEDE
ncbi:N-acetyltransferase [Desmospora profundinema]|uniref:Ribosomal protein S18 acetylase RimI-like enzyme n=1 Tax=Desmospora profundinema TaxID=1571184 RepID=A0ABU1IPK4_9BACL|nr:N-acetyltransferase [Desmospora profundinema]MDR6226727.1 ribosomal protein S18 acetylase RimI-like enzyme [Desmospora profundinema]